MEVKDMSKEDAKAIKQEANKLHFMNNMFSAINSVDNLTKIRDNLNRSTVVNMTSLKNALKSPSKIKNSKTLQDILYMYKNMNGILKQFINYQSNILTNDHFLVPLDVSKFKSQEEMWKKELEAAKFLELFNIKKNFLWMYDEFLTYGELYIYLEDNKVSFIPLKIPSQYCVIFGKDEYMNSKFAIDLSSIKEDTLSYYPKEIQDAWLKKKNGTLNKEELIDNKYYKVGENGVAFTLEEWEIKGYPYFSHIIESLVKLDNIQDLEAANAVLNNFKIIHQLIPTDDKGDILLGYDDVLTYHEALKSSVPSGIGTVTSPMKLSGISLGDTTSKNMDYSNQIKKNIYDVSGFNDDLFNGSKSSNEAIAMGSVVDTLLPLRMQSLFANWINSVLRKTGKTKNWKVCFIESTQYTKQKTVQTERENLAVYGSKKKYLAAQGFTPLEAMNIIKNEELLGISEMMLPMQTSHTLSGSGRPSNAENPNTPVQTGEEV